MRLPHGENAVIDARKLTEYVLSPTHPHGRAHAFLFDRLLGITTANMQVLKDALQAAALDGDCTETVDQGYGQKYEMRFPMTGPRGVYTVLAVWIVPHGDDRPNLVTAYIE